MTRADSHGQTVEITEGKAPTARTPGERAGVRTVVGSQTDDRVARVREAAAKRLAADDAQPARQAQRAADVAADAARHRPVRLGGLLLTKGER